jgi:transcriptional regulator with XRE-family HTH domain
MAMKLGEMIKQNRLSRQLSLRGFALLCGINHSYLSGIEKGLNYSFTIETLQKLANGMKISLYELMAKAGYFEHDERSVKDA